MKVQTKLIASTVPILLVVFFLLGYLAFLTSRRIIHENINTNISAVLDARIHSTFQPRSDLLKSSKMDTVESFVNLYQHEAFQDLLTGSDSKIGCFTIIDKNGDTIFTTGDCGDALTRAELKKDVWSHKKTNTDHLKGTIKVKGRKYIYGARFFSPWEYTLVYCVDSARSEKGISNIFHATIGLTGICVVTCALVIIFVTRRVIGSPIVQLKKAASRIANMEKNVMVNVDTADEFKELSDSINTMALEISDYIHQIEQVKMDLEKTNESLRISERTIQQTVSAGNVGLWDWDLLSGKVLYSPQWKKQLGYADYEITEECAEWEDRIHPDDRDHTIRLLKRSVKEPYHPYKVEFRLKHKDGAYRWILAEGALEYDESMYPSRMKGSHVDITDLKLAQEAIVKASEEWQQTFDSVPDSVALLDVDHKILRANKTMMDRLGLTSDQVIGRYCYEIVHGSSSPLDNCPHKRLVNSLKEETSEYFDERNGTFFEIRSAPVHDKASCLIGSVHIMRDITEHRKLEEMLRQSQRMEALGTLAGGIAHDFNNILTPILGFTEIACMNLNPDDPISEDLSQVLSAANRAKELVNQILTFSRKTRVELKPLKIQFVIKEALKLLRSSIPSHIKIHEDIGPNCSAVMADVTHIYQILMNLCTNAYQAMLENGGTLRVALNDVTITPDKKDNNAEPLPGVYVLLEVCDTGPGIPREISERIFEPYFTTKGEGHGTGLGLAVVHGIITSYKGTVKVKSEPGKGTDFQVYFPAIQTVLTEQHINERIETLPGGDERILLIDDEEIVTDMLEKSLASYGYRVSSFLSSTDALSEFKKQPDAYDMVISDITMPHISGDKLADRILSIRPGIPIILVTGYSPLYSKEDAKKLGISEYLTKPVHIQELLLAVRNLLDKRKTV